MKKLLYASLLGIASTASAQDPVAVAIPGPLVPAYAPLPTHGYPIAPVGGGYVVPGMPGHPVMYGYPPVGFPAHPFAQQQSFHQHPMMMPVSYQSGPMYPAMAPMPLPTGTIIEEKPGKKSKREAPPEHFGPHYSLDYTGIYDRRALVPTNAPVPLDPAVINRE